MDFLSYQFLCTILVGLFLASILVIRTFTFLKKRVSKKPIQYTVMTAAEAHLLRTGRTVLICGGCGFLGRYILKQMLDDPERDYDIVVFDASTPSKQAAEPCHVPYFPVVIGDPRVTYVRGDVLRVAHLEKTMRDLKVTAVLHLVALLPLLTVSEEDLWAVNVEGTRNVVRAAMKCKETVRQLVYTSSCTVVLPRDEKFVFEGTEEALAYPAEHVDVYTETKEVAEKLVMQAGEEKGSLLDTCVLRPGGIYGIGDRLMADMYSSNVSFVIGKGEDMIEFVSVENVAHAHVLAMKGLVKEEEAKEEKVEKKKKKTISGNAYFIGSGENCQYKRFIGQGTDFRGDKNKCWWGQACPASLPVWFIMILSYINVWSYVVLGFGLLQQDAFTPMSINFTQRTYTFKYDKAQRDFGYQPLCTIEESVDRIVRKKAELNQQMDMFKKKQNTTSSGSS
eukprot:Nk52_evm152s226 gene=Nk52_evmTU152s226